MCKFMSIVLLILVAAFARAQERQGPPQLTRSIELTAQPDSEFKFIEGSTHLYILKDVNGRPGKGFAHSWGSDPKKETDVQFKYSIDEKKGTYKAHRLSDEEAAAFVTELNMQPQKTVTTPPEHQQLDESEIPPQHQHAKADGETWTTNADAPIAGVDLAPPPDGCPCEGQECSFSLSAWEGTQNTWWPHPHYTRTMLTGSGHRFVNNLQRCQWSSTSGIGYYSTYAWPAAHFVVNPALPPHQEGPHAWGVMPSHWDMTATGDYKCADCPNTWSEDKITATYETQGYPYPFVFNGYHADYGETSGALEGYGGSTSVSSCNQ